MIQVLLGGFLDPLERVPRRENHVEGEQIHPPLPGIGRRGRGQTAEVEHVEVIHRLRFAVDVQLEIAARQTSYGLPVDRKSTRLNSSHTVISYAVFCLKKKK